MWSIQTEKKHKTKWLTSKGKVVNRINSYLCLNRFLSAHVGLCENNCNACPLYFTRWCKRCCTWAFHLPYKTNFEKFKTRRIALRRRQNLNIINMWNFYIFTCDWFGETLLYSALRCFDGMPMKVFNFTQQSAVDVKRSFMFRMLKQRNLFSAERVSLLQRLKWEMKEVKMNVATKLPRRYLWEVKDSWSR